MAARRQLQLLSAGSPAPEFRLPLLGGGELSSTEILSGGDALLAFFKITCPVCQLTLPFLERLHQAGAQRIYAISQNDAEDTREFNEDFRLTLPTLLDTEETNFEVSNAYRISSVPTMFLAGRDGRIARVIEGWSRRDMESLGMRFEAGDRVPEWKAG